MPGIRDLLRGVGEASAAPFAPAPFQLAALEALERGDVLVSAPTGSGKTWIAEQEIARFLEGAKVPPGAGAAHPGARNSGAPGIWYTTPLKALSNQKFRRFQRLYGEAAVGLLTGERRVNPHAPVVVATTEILRNALYDSSGNQPSPDVVVLDEAHYLADPERGTAWEEILLLAPPGTRLLLLSATVPNSAEIAAWMGTVRGRLPEVITLQERPVPLAFLLADGAGRLLPPEPTRVHTRTHNPRWLPTVADGLVDHGLTPAILFFPSRRGCDEAARQLGSRPATGEEERAERLRDWITRVPQLAAHPLLAALRRAGVAPHHAGHLTAWRMCVEEMLEAGLVRLVCATTTLAAGLDVPARTVVLSTLYRHGPAGPEPLTPTEFHQMTGRAGRRGRDTLGIAVIGVTAPDEAREGLALAAASPDPVRSTFVPSDAQVLNLLARAPAADAEALLRRSFAVFLRAPQIADVRSRLEVLPPDPLTDRPCGDRLTTRRRFDALLRDLRRARRGKKDAAEVARLGEAVLSMPCTGCPVVDRCLASIADLEALERERRALTRELADLEDREVREFRTRADILRALGYLDSERRLTSQGRLAARIRHPRMLVLAEALRAGLFPLDPRGLAAVAGALGTERVTPPGGLRRRGAGRAAGYRRLHEDIRRPHPSADVAVSARAALGGLRKIIGRLNAMRRDAGLPIDPLEAEFTVGGDAGPAPALVRAAVIGSWAEGRPWAELATRHHIPDGDLQRLVWQAAEILAQIEDLPENPVSVPARTARDALLRPPVL
jgi:superfamily II RNA helicase